MLALKHGTKIVFRVTLITVVLLNAFAPVSVMAMTEGRGNKNHSFDFVSSSFEPGHSSYRNNALSAFLDSMIDTLKGNNNHVLQTPACQADSNNDLIILSGSECALEAGTHFFHNIDIQSNGTLILRGDPDTGTGVVLQAENLIVNGTISADGQGFPAGMGPGKGEDGTDIDHLAGGGGYGGDGGNGEGGIAGGSGYGSIYTPTMLGSGGGNFGNVAGGAGGGAIKLKIANMLTLNGKISADGMDGEYNDVLEVYSGGGSGGSIWIETLVFTGSGKIYVDGGGGWGSSPEDQYVSPGGGAGGRIAIDVPIIGNTFTGNVQAYGEGGWGDLGNYWLSIGGSGTTYWITEDKLVVDGYWNLLLSV